MLDDRMKEIAKRHAHKSEKVFFKYLMWCGWEEEQITDMWKYAQKYIKEKQE